MYGWIWRKLPFGLPGKLIGSLLLATTVVALLWYVVFPWAGPLLPFTGEDVQVTQQDSEVPGAPGDVEPGTDPADDEPAGDEHDLPYDTDRNNTPPPDEDE
ncbi:MULTISPECIES: hypothetical protein [Micromonospora]|uniref:Uncharacterized protein n=1 Tax=Micromonospora maris TaxID=1003110 RepID=A0A9X0I5Z5_9ACTN|nr:MULTISPECIES: hypothetical protein [Micromonospora]AEB42096.1 hypothetical protein VAB18032_04850 [Micromonospora maris AB-18-032]KUJ47624.1 hypothetical protein ADL17_00360 [Micromonospora maris]RUL91504.1 hypothetical protein EG812_19510 [Verrucosispora sp. FIM060022]